MENGWVCKAECAGKGMHGDIPYLLVASVFVWERLSSLRLLDLINYNLYHWKQVQ